MIDLIASLVIDLSDQHLITCDQNLQAMRVIRVNTGKTSTPSPVFESKVLTKYRSVSMQRGSYTFQGIPCKVFVSANQLIAAGSGSLAVLQHSTEHPRENSGLTIQVTGRSPGWPQTGFSGAGSSGASGPCSINGSLRSASQASNQFTAVARRVRRG